MIGRRVIDDSKSPSCFEAGEYGRYKGILYGRPPGTDLLANLSAHLITELEDGTMTVAPSILINQGRPNEWHGFLTRGVWSKV